MTSFRPALAQPPIQSLVALLQRGQFDALVREATVCTTRWPAAGPVWHLLGLAYLNLGRPAEAVAPLARASKLLPREAQILEQLGIAQMQSGRATDASRSFERCLTLAPGQAGVLINLAHLANDTGRHAAAERYCRQALRLIPGQPQLLFNLGRALRGLGQTAEAIGSLQQAAAGAADSPVAQNDVGLELQALGAHDAAERCFRQALTLAPGYAIAHSNLGRLLNLLGRVDEALTAFEQAATLEPELAAAHANLGSQLNLLRRFEAGERACRRAIELDPRLPVAHANLGNALLGQRRHAEAESAYRQALMLDDGIADAWNNLGNLLQDVRRFDEALACYRRLGEHDGAGVGNAFHCAAQVCDWQRRARDETALRRLLDAETADIGPFGLLAMSADDAPRLQRQAGRLYATTHYRVALAQPPRVAPDTHPQRERLRIGYLSADFHDHATMHLLGGVLAAHDRARVAVHLYSYGPDATDGGRQAALRAAEVFRDLAPLPDAAAAARIAADGIDILVDLKGYTQDARLGITALRPAPLIVSWLGYPGTLGHEHLADYLIGDPVVTPLAHAAHFSETLALLPHCYQPNDRLRPIGPRPSREAAGLPENAFVFCSFNQAYKFNPLVFDHWCRLLGSVPGSVLWLLQPPAAATVDNLRREAARRGIAPERLLFAPPLPQAAHLGRLQLADLALDTYPYGSHTTGSDALWVGVPLLTHPGDTFASRVGASLLHAAGLPELVAGSWEAYIELARTLAGDPERLAALRTTLLRQREACPLFDTEGFCRALEALYERLWQQHAQGKRSALSLAAD